MLSLMRRVGKNQNETIVFFDDDGTAIAELSLVEKRGEQVTIAINAQKKIIVKRNELLDDVKKSQIEKDLRQ